MNNNLLIVYFFIIFSSFSCKDFGVIPKMDMKDCQELIDANKYLYLNGSYVSLIDNGLRCMGLNSLPNWNEKITRIWRYDYYMVGDKYVSRLKLFQYGLRDNNSFANFYILEWIAEKPNQKDINLKVICLNKKEMQPIEGWEEFNKSLIFQKIDSLNTIPANKDLPLSTGYDFAFVQYLNSDIVHTVDFSNRSGNLQNSQDTREMGYINLIKKIYYSFGIKMSENKDGEDSLDY